MGMSNYANYADVFDEKQIKKICPKSYKIFKRELSLIDITYNSYDIIELIGTPESFDKAIQDLQDDFEVATGLQLVLLYHSTEERGDEVDGFFFHVDNAYQFTEEAKKFKKYIQRKFWVTYG
jgi:hypothetical protein